jgi:hypothetical protein
MLMDQIPRPKIRERLPRPELHSENRGTFARGRLNNKGNSIDKRRNSNRLGSSRIEPEPKTTRTKQIMRESGRRTRGSKGGCKRRVNGTR